MYHAGTFANTRGAPATRAHVTDGHMYRDSPIAHPHHASTDAHVLENPAQLRALVAEQRRRAPRVPRAYRPSGRSAPGAWRALLGAGLLAGMRGLVLALVLCATVVGLTALGDWILTWKYNSNFLFLLALALHFGGSFLIGLVAFLPFTMVRNAILGAARRAHCRSPGLARSIAVLIVVLGCVCMVAIAKLLLIAAPTWAVLAEVREPSGPVLVGSHLGVAFALWNGTYVDLRSGAPFCERCEKHMTSLMLPTRRLEDLSAMRAMLDGAPGVALIEAHAPLCLESVLWSCPACQQGYVDGRALLRLGFPKHNELQRKSVDWLCLSAAVAPAVVTSLRQRLAESAAARTCAAMSSTEDAEDAFFGAHDQQA